MARGRISQALRAFAPAGVIPAALLPRPTDPVRSEFTQRVAEREGLLGATRLVPSLRFGTAVARAPASPSQPDLPLSRFNL